jgi:glycosyltransferase involved in cell wall biosynthesis
MPELSLKGVLPGQLQPMVSIILPTYNRAAFLPQAFASIKDQHLTDWELIVVDDGSIDETKSLAAEFASRQHHPVRYTYQENQGAYSARNTGLDSASGKYIAFFDSDDYWLPNHLADCVGALEANADVDWVYGACRIVNACSGKTVVDNTFYRNGKPRPFLNLRAARRGGLQLIQDPKAIHCAILHGLYCGLQNSVIRRTFFVNDRFHTAYRNEAEDQLVVIRGLAAGKRFGFFDKIHVVYNVHVSNSSASSLDGNTDRRVEVLRYVARGFEDLAKERILAPDDVQALRQRLGREYFWHLGYSQLWQNGRHEEALQCFRHGLGLCPWNLLFWKTYVLSLVRTLLRSRK